MKLSLPNFEERPSLRHLKRLTTKDGLIQHADLEVPDPSFGYSIDDNARALIACLWHYQLFQDPAVLQLAEIYFHYIERVEKEGGSFHNFLSFSEKVLDSEGSEDSIGRAIWALGETISRHPDVAVKDRAKAIFDRTNISRHLEHPHVRTKAYILLGLLSAKKLDEAKRWADYLVKIFEKSASDDWQWFEDGLYYGNGILPYALARAAVELKDQHYGEIAQKSYDWLDKVSRTNNIVAPIGQNGWYMKGAEKALYDQQPLEAADMILAACQLFELTKDSKYPQSLADWYGWYQGNNLQQLKLINNETAGIYDGLTPGGVNKNQGAESIVTYLLAHLAIVILSRNDE